LQVLESNKELQDTFKKIRLEGGFIGRHTYLDEIVQCCSGRHFAFVIGNRLEGLEITLQLVVKMQNRSNVTATVAIVGGRPHSDELVVEHVLVTLLHKLMRTADKLKLVGLNEVSGDAGAEQPTSTTRTDLPSFDFFRIGPHEIAEGTLVRDFLAARNGADLI